MNVSETLDISGDPSMKKPSGQETTAGTHRAGFTLIELLTVIAIIAILAGMSAVAVPKYLEKAHTTQSVANIENVAKALAAKAAETGNTGGYPPAYGFVLPEYRDLDVATLLAAPVPPVESYFVTTPYTAAVGIHGVENMYEIPNWSLTGFDSDGNGQLGLLEFAPIGEKNIAGNTYSFSTEVYAGPNGELPAGFADPTTLGGLSELSLQSDRDNARPFVYVPFNKRQLAAVRRYWLDPGVNEPLGENIDPGHSLLSGRLFFPPPQYDGFVLIGAGPDGTTGGVVADPPVGFEPAYAYHYAALRTAFLATRDLNDDKLPDFDFQARKSLNEVIMLPNDTNGQGPIIKIVQ
jgi:prepilin-type N-terminal cleavage/methylation domain-containing protein